MCLSALNCRREAKCNYTVFFCRFDDYFRGVFQRFDTRFDSAIAQAFILWFLEMTFGFWCLVFIDFGYP